MVVFHFSEQWHKNSGLLRQGLCGRSWHRLDGKNNCFSLRKLTIDHLGVSTAIAKNKKGVMCKGCVDKYTIIAFGQEDLL